MATQAHSLLQDRNANVPFKGDGPKVRKSASNGGRKALADVSNSTKPISRQSSVLKTVRHGKKASSDKLSTDNWQNFAPKMASSTNGLKPSICQASENNTLKGKGNLRGRKALIDLSNSSSKAKPLASKTNCVKKIGAITDEIENFQHNHQACINLQNKAMDMNFILKTVGLDVPLPPLKKAITDEIGAITDEIETFEHNHQACINLQKEATMDMDFILKTLGLDDPLPPSPEPEVPELELDLELEFLLPRPMHFDVQTPTKELELLEESPRCGMSPVFWEFKTPRFKLMDTPKSMGRC